MYYVFLIQRNIQILPFFVWFIQKCVIKIVAFYAMLSVWLQWKWKSLLTKTTCINHNNLAILYVQYINSMSFCHFFKKFVLFYITDLVKSLFSSILLFSGTEHFYRMFRYSIVKASVEVLKNVWNLIFIKCSSIFHNQPMQFLND